MSPTATKMTEKTGREEEWIDGGREGESMNTIGHHWAIKVRAQRTDVDKH